MRRGVLLDLVLTDQEELVGNVMAGDSLSCNEHEVVEFRTLCEGSRTISWTKTMDFSNVNFDLLKVMLGRIPWDRGLESRGSKKAG